MLNVHNTSNEIRVMDLSKREIYNNVAVFDIDEVIWGINHAYLAEVNKALGTTYSVEQLHKYDMCKQFDIPYPLFTDVLHKTDAFSRVKVFQHSHTMIEGFKNGSLCSHFGLMNEPHSVVFITHRGFRPDGLKITYDLLMKHNLVPDVLIAAPLGTSKLDIADDMFGHELCCIVEDKPSTLQEFSEAGFITIKSHKPWNVDVWSDYSIDLEKSVMPL